MTGLTPSSSILSLDELAKLTRTGHARGTPDLYATYEEVTALWKSLQDTVNSPAVSDKHMTAACNAICFVARNTISSQDDPINAFGFSKKVWSDTFLAARSAFSSGKNKPALQVLDTLAYLSIANPDDKLVRQCVSEAAETMIRIVFLQQPKKCLKEACIVLYFFLRKLSDLMSFSDVLKSSYRDTRMTFAQLCRIHKINLEPDTPGNGTIWLYFMLALLMCVSVAESKSATLKLLALLPVLFAPGTGVELKDVMRHAITTFGAADETAMESVVKDVLPSVLSDQDQFFALLPRLDMPVTKTEATLRLYLAQLRFGQSKGYISSHYMTKLLDRRICHDETSNTTAYGGFRQLVQNSFPAVRQSACELLLASCTSKHLPTVEALACLQDSLPTLHDDLDAYARGELFSTFRKFLISIRASELPDAAISQRTTSTDNMGSVRTFLQTYLAFLKSELAVHLPYGRHILALDLLCFLLSDAAAKQQSKMTAAIMDKDTVIALFSLISDPYDDVRGSAAQALSYALKSDNEQIKHTLVAIKNYVQPDLNVGSTASRTNRADHADAMGRMTPLIAGILRSSHKDLNDAVTISNHVTSLRWIVCSLETFDITFVYPLHGKLLGVSYLLLNAETNYFSTDLTLTISMLLEICQQIWVLSEAHLCVDSPEVETDTSEDGGSSGPKDLLAYAWRILRDSHILMQSMLQVLPTQLKLFHGIGGLCFEQLRSLRHRGAFSAVSQTFLLCCQKIRGSDDSLAEALIERWLSESFRELDVQANKLTRRSAGLPAMFAALLDPVHPVSFSIGFEQLTTLATQPQPKFDQDTRQVNLRLPQVHALNCIKDIMTNSRFRNMTEPLVVGTLNLAANAMTSPVWAIKNCGLMLLRASINRLDPDTSLGAAEAGLKLRTGSDTTKTPLQIAVEMLGYSIDNDSASGNSVAAIHYGESSTEAVFASLDILGRLYIRVHERATIQQIITKTLGNRLWLIRTQAARLLSNMTVSGDELSTIEYMFGLLPESQSTNKQHGVLLVVKHLVRRLILEHEPARYIVQLLFLASFRVNDVIRDHPALKAVWAQIWYDLCMIVRDCSAKVREGLSIPLDLHYAKQFDGMPAAALHRRATTLATLHLGRGYGEGFGSINTTSVRTALCDDEDSACWTFDQIRTSPKRHDSADLLQTLIRSITTATTAISEDVLAANMEVIVVDTNTGPFVMHDPEILTLMSEINFERPVTRDLMISQFKLYTLLCEVVWTIGKRQQISTIKDSSRAFCLHLRAAVNESTNESSRMGALQALSRWQHLSTLDDMLARIFEDIDRLEILSVIYDLLNDDDQEIRSGACIVAARLHNTAESVLSVTTMLSASASRRQLRSMIVDRFHQDNQDMLQLECVRRLLGIPMNVYRSRLGDAIKHHLQEHTVQAQLNQITTTATDLFAEEKQNLYIDEVAEVKSWAILNSNLFSNGALSAKLKLWIRQGLEQFRRYFVEVYDGSADGLYDFELLLIRVITLARLYGGYGEKLEDLKSLVTQEHEGVKYHTRLSTTAYSAFTWSLEQQ